jgi:hypothetical protein
MSIDGMFITCVLDIVDPERKLTPQDVIKKIETIFKTKCQCGADAVYHYCRICWCMEIDCQKKIESEE